jgi:hypothetical protein
MSAGTACGFTQHGTNQVGTCRAGLDPKQTTLACVPGQGRSRGPPTEAVAACSSLSAAATCAFTLGASNLVGTCKTAGDQLACAPAPSP